MCDKSDTAVFGNGLCCREQNCPFRNTESSTNKAVYCDDKECVDLVSDGYGHCGNCTIQELADYKKCPKQSSLGDRCYYATYYEDGSSSYGTFRQDVLHLPTGKDNHAVNLAFGCGRYQTGLLFKDPYRPSFVDGILGLGRGTYGLPSVLANNGYKKVFAHCLGGGSGGGLLTFGEPQGINDDEVQFTPFTPGESPLKYYVDFNDVSVGKTRLGVLNGSCATRGALVDSGAAITRLPGRAYEAIMREIMDQAKIPFNVTLSKEMTFTCFSGHLKKGADDAEAVNEVLPTITLHLGGIDVEIRPSDYTLRWKPEEGLLRPCVFLMADEQCVIGVSVMRNYLVIYDMENSAAGGLGRLGWKRSYCETGRGTIVNSPEVQSDSCH
ncbi:hypothetical protein CBR_g38968 [Chara braunii]|uniref:Peptidase A1 domain-containing protein n=1 Tax=Chara braunii TaxID=69332 RepID=A0A388K0V1_CHABU|nr:hypothetical protein CBR_g38968 [Chara braunii]|eukprot:GBG63657.1 hypothetical protein CBR_g38968 [Chara braunii]